MIERERSNAKSHLIQLTDTTICFYEFRLMYSRCEFASSLCFNEVNLCEIIYFFSEANRQKEGVQLSCNDSRKLFLHNRRLDVFNRNQRLINDLKKKKKRQANETM